MPTVLGTHGLTRRFDTPAGPLLVLAGLDLEVAAGEVVAITGPSGSGKSTLLHLLAGLDRPSAGEVWWGDLAVHALSAERVARARAGRVGLVFQHHHLLADLSAHENVTLPGRVAGRVDARRGDALLEAVGLTARRDARPRTLSGGERLRVAVARALYARPAVVLADEPTGSLDRASADAVVDALLAAVAADGAALVLVTHDARVAARADRRARLDGGRLVPEPSVDA
ncbi:MAG: ABC transporter ATP-binding protein [Trueperaceae bacterium]|nr:ABC transporter ATP-binding protein [Trueperaceae bacterium]